MLCTSFRPQSWRRAAARVARMVRQPGRPTVTDASAFSSGGYWEARYRAGGTSGAGSYGRLAAFKAAFINAFIADNLIHDVLDLGCGDGNLLSLLDVPSYVGIDVSPTTLMRCASRFAARSNCVFLPPARLDEVTPVDLAVS